MYRNNSKDVQQHAKRYTSFINIILMLLKTAIDEHKNGY